MKTVKQGSKGYEVEYLQRLINKAASRDGVVATALVVDGHFGPLTDKALKAFQGRHKPLVVDGVAGGKSWGALGLKTEKEHNNVRIFGQPTGTSCWSAAATMVLGNQSVGPGGADLGAGGGLLPSMENLERFAKGLGWQMPNFSPTVETLVTIVQRQPVWICGGGSNWAHAVVLSGVFSDGSTGGDGTMFRIHDPWPIGVGKVYGSFANPLTMYNANGTARVEARLDYVLIPA